MDTNRQQEIFEKGFKFGRIKNGNRIIDDAMIDLDSLKKTKQTKKYSRNDIL